MRRSSAWWDPGTPGLLVTAAGILHRDPLEETSEAVWHRVLDVVLTGTFHAIQAAVPGMRAQGYGKIVTISSISGIIGGAVSRAGDSPDARRGRSGPAYAAAKGGVIALTRWVAKDLGQNGIYVNSVAPGGVETEMTRGYAYAAGTFRSRGWGSRRTSPRPFSSWRRPPRTT